MRRVIWSFRWVFRWPIDDSIEKIQGLEGEREQRPIKYGMTDL